MEYYSANLLKLICEYENGSRIKQISYDETGNRIEELYHDDDRCYSHTEYDYNNTVIYNYECIPENYFVVVHYSDGSLYLVIEWNNDGTLANRILYEQDGSKCVTHYDGGNLNENIYYNSDGILLSCDEFYINGIKKSLAIYVNGIINYLIEFDSAGNTIRETYYDSEGSVIEVKTYEP